MLRKFALYLLAMVFWVSGLRGQNSYDWNNAGLDGLFSTAENWGGGSAPTSAQGNTINFWVGGTAQNDLGTLEVEILNFSANEMVVTGNELTNVWRIQYFSSGSGRSTIAADITTYSWGFSVSSSYADQYFDFKKAVTLRDPGYAFFWGSSAYANGASFSGAEGVFNAIVPSVVDVSRMTVTFDNSEAANTERWTGESLLKLRDRGRLQLIGNESVDVTQGVASLQVNFSEVLEVQNRGTTTVATLEIGELTTMNGAVLLHRSPGGANQVLGEEDGPKIKYNGQGTTDFLGPQMFYLSGDLEGGTGSVEYAAYDADRGVISATTDLNNAETINEATANVLQTQNAGSVFDGESTMHSLAYNAGALYGEGVFNLTHLLIGPNAYLLGVGLDFGDRAGSITLDGWNSITSPKQIYLISNIMGSNEITFRGADNLYLMGNSSFSGTARFAGADVLMEISGQLAEASAVVLGTEGKMTRLTLSGGGNRLADDGEILITGESMLHVYGNASSEGSELVGDIVVQMAMDNAFDQRRFHFSVASSQDGATMAFTAKSLSYAEDAVGNRVDLWVEGDGSSLTINGGEIVLKNGNSLYMDLRTTNTRLELEGGVMIALGEEGTVGINASNDTEDPFAASLAGNFNLQDGTLDLLNTHGLLTLEGDLTMGEGLETYLYLNEANIGAALLAIQGDVRLDGTLFVSSGNGYGEGEWLLFSATGNIVDGGWDVQGQDGDYFYRIDGQNVYLTTTPIPEPGTGMLLAAGLAGLGARRFRRRD